MLMDRVPPGGYDGRVDLAEALALLGGAVVEGTTSC